MHSHLIDFNVDTIKIEYIRFDIFDDYPEIEIGITLRNKANKKIGIYRLSSQKYHSDIQYDVPGNIRDMVMPLIEAISEDVFTRYVQ